MKTFIPIIITIILAAIWGYSQHLLFPYEKYGNLILLTSFIGGCIIGFIVPFIAYKLKFI